MRIGQQPLTGAALPFLHHGRWPRHQAGRRGSTADDGVDQGGHGRLRLVLGGSPCRSGWPVDGACGLAPGRLQVSVSAVGARTCTVLMPAPGTAWLAATQLRCTPAGLRSVRGGVGNDVQVASVRFERHGPHASGALGHSRSEGRRRSRRGRCRLRPGRPAALGHHPADCDAQSERLATVAPYDGGGARPGGGVLLRRLPGRDQDLAGEAGATQLGGHAITVPVTSPSSGRAARPGSRSIHDAGVSVRAADRPRPCHRSRCGRTAVGAVPCRDRHHTNQPMTSPQRNAPLTVEGRRRLINAAAQLPPVTTLFRPGLAVRRNVQNGRYRNAGPFGGCADGITATRRGAQGRVRNLDSAPNGGRGPASSAQPATLARLQHASSHSQQEKARWLCNL